MFCFFLVGDVDKSNRDVKVGAMVVDHDKILNNKPMVNEGSGRGDIAQRHLGVQHNTLVVLFSFSFAVKNINFNVKRKKVEL